MRQAGRRCNRIVKLRPVQGRRSEAQGNGCSDGGPQPRPPPFQALRRPPAGCAGPVEHADLALFAQSPSNSPLGEQCGASAAANGAGKGARRADSARRKRRQARCIPFPPPRNQPCCIKRASTVPGEGLSTGPTPFLKLGSMGPVPKSDLEDFPPRTPLSGRGRRRRCSSARPATRSPSGRTGRARAPGCG